MTGWILNLKEEQKPDGWIKAITKYCSGNQNVFFLVISSIQ